MFRRYKLHAVTRFFGQGQGRYATDVYFDGAIYFEICFAVIFGATLRTNLRVAFFISTEGIINDKN